MRHDSPSISRRVCALKTKNSPLKIRGLWRRHPDLNRRIGDLQSPALPLGYGAAPSVCFSRFQSCPCVGWDKISIFRSDLLSKLNPGIQFCKRGVGAAEWAPFRIESGDSILKSGIRPKAASCERLGKNPRIPGQNL